MGRYYGVIWQFKHLSYGTVIVENMFESFNEILYVPKLRVSILTAYSMDKNATAFLYKHIYGETVRQATILDFFSISESVYKIITRIGHSDKFYLLNRIQSIEVTVQRGGIKERIFYRGLLNVDLVKKQYFCIKSVLLLSLSRVRRFENQQF